MRLYSPIIARLARRALHIDARGMAGNAKAAPGALKRKADNNLDRMNIATRNTRQKPLSASIPLAYPNGALRITRTPGRKDAKNCVNLRDVIHKDQLKSACIYSFFIAEEDLYEHLPLSHAPGGIPIYIGRDPNMDVAVEKTTGRISRERLDAARDYLQLHHSKEYGQNLRTFYAWGPGSSHSKILLLVYPTFLRIVITSCNMMSSDTELGDNHWYIHDLPKHPPNDIRVATPFEFELLAHLTALGTPTAFINSIRGMYDYSTVKVHLLTSIPGTFSHTSAERHGLLALRRHVQKLDLELPNKGQSGNLQVEVCAASVGNINAKWLNDFYDCALGKEKLQTKKKSRDVPNIKLFYPTTQDVKQAGEASRDAAMNIGCHLRPWDTAPREVKQIFHHYESKDSGKLFHQKLIVAYNPQDTTRLPYYVYVGSANLSQAAWGALELDKKGNTLTSDTKLVKVSNFECGVFIPGHLIKDLLEDGTEGWQAGIIPHSQTTAPYDLSTDKAWNDYRWITGS